MRKELISLFWAILCVLFIVIFLQYFDEFRRPLGMIRVFLFIPFVLVGSLYTLRLLFKKIQGKDNSILGYLLLAPMLLVGLYLLVNTLTLFNIN